MNDDQAIPANRSIALNLRFHLADGDSVTIYDVYPRSQGKPIPIPAGADTVAIYLGIRSRETSPTRTREGHITTEREPG
jgi:hypothetical protein